MPAVSYFILEKMVQELPGRIFMKMGSVRSL